MLGRNSISFQIAEQVIDISLRLMYEDQCRMPPIDGTKHTFKKFVSEVSILICRDGIDSNAVLPPCFKCQYLQCPKPTSLV
jgi:hypothetical protein